MRALYAVVVVLLLAAFSSPVLAGNKDFVVQFDDCAEYVGIGLVPAEGVRELVPSQYELALIGSDAQLVVRVASCSNVSIDGQKSGPARTAQIGVTLASTADPNFQIDNFLLWFVTSSGKLHGKLQAAGIKNGNDQQLQFVFDPITADGGKLTIKVDAPSFPAFPLFGDTQYPSSPPQMYLANWYADSTQGTLLMQTRFLQLSFGKAELVLTPPASSELAELLDSSSLQFSKLNSYNEWSTATMEATLR